MKTLEKGFVGLQAVAVLYLIFTGNWMTIIGGLFLLFLLNVGIKLFNMYRLDPMERQRYEEEGGSGIWC
jgi:hypothetical protein